MPRLPNTPPATDEAMTAALLEAMVPVGGEGSTGEEEGSWGAVGSGDSTGLGEGRWGAVGCGDSTGLGEGFSQVFKLILSSGFTGSRSSYIGRIKY